MTRPGTDEISQALARRRARRLTAILATVQPMLPLVVIAVAIGAVASILLVIGGSGAFKQVLVASGVNSRIGEAMQGLPFDPLVLAWLVTAVIRVCVGSATVAGLTAAGILAPIVSVVGLAGVLVLARIV